MHRLRVWTGATGATVGTARVTSRRARVEGTMAEFGVGPMFFQPDEWDDAIECLLAGS